MFYIIVTVILLGAYLKVRYNKTREITRQTYHSPRRHKEPWPAWLFYAKDVRQDVRNRNPRASMGVIDEIIQEKWRNLTHEQRDVYNMMASVDLMWYNMDRDIPCEYKPTPFEQYFEKLQYEIWATPNVPFTQLISAAKRKWSELSTEERQRYAY